MERTVLSCPQLVLVWVLGYGRVKTTTRKLSISTFLIKMAPIRKIGIQATMQGRRKNTSLLMRFGTMKKSLDNFGNLRKVGVHVSHISYSPDEERLNNSPASTCNTVLHGLDNFYQRNEDLSA
jgi:16S rRNA U1498 N3-methylase RsmE